MINAESISKMKPGVRIINCARGEIINQTDLVAALVSGKVSGAALDVFAAEPLAADHPLRSLPNVILTPHLGASTEEAQEKCGLEVAEIITSFLLTGEVRNAVNLPGVDAKSFEIIQPYVALGEKIGKLLSQMGASGVDRIYVTFGGKAKDLPATDPVTRAVLKGFLSTNGPQDVNTINVRSIASNLGITVEEKRSDEPVTFNEWLHVQLFAGDTKVGSAGGTFFGSPNNPRIVRLFSTAVEIPTKGTLLLLNHQDRPGMIGKLGSILADHNVNIASMSLGRETAGGQALTVLLLDTKPLKDCLDQLAADRAIYNVRVVTL
jgi:D-3-phosphoglycerate dehydrogenase